MSRSIQNAVHSREVQTLNGVRLSPAKAQLDSPPESTPVEGGLLHRLASIKESALLAAHGSQKAASIEIGCDQSQLKRQMRIGTFDTRQEAAAGETYLATLGAMLVEEFGAARKSKKQIARERLPELLDIMLAGLED